MTFYKEIYDRVFQILNSRLPSFLSYHSPDHTTYVLEQAEIISQQEGVNGNELDLIKLAVLFHDIGFIKQYKNHEEAGCLIARDFLNDYPITADEIDRICNMIMATKIPQTPATLSDKIVTDADLEYLGTDSFYPISQRLFREFKYFDPDLDEEGFRQIQIKFISAHRYHTDYCRKKREAKKQENLRALIEHRL
jgi:uncharacterized protein